MIKINRETADTLINSVDYFDNETYDVVYYTIYYENIAPKQLRRSTYSNLETEYSLNGAIALTIVRLEYEIIDEEIQSNVINTYIDSYQII